GVAKRPSGGSQPNPGHFRQTSSAQTLVDGVVFAINGEQGFALTAHLGSKQFTSGHQAFLVGETDRFASLHRLISCFETGHPNNRTDHEINFRVGGYSDRARSSVGDL